MAEWSGFFDAHKVGESWDRVYLAEDFAKFFSPLIGNGVFAGRSNELQVFQSVPAGMSVTVSSGQSWIDGYGYLNDSDLTVFVDPADGALGRIDRIVNQWSAVDRQIRTVWKKGTPAVNPVAPSLQWDADYKELNLCTLDITAGLSAITQDKIKDTRADSSVCGWVTGLIDQVDTSTLFAQWDAAYEKAFAATEDYLEAQKAAWEAFFENVTQDLIIPVPSLEDAGKIPEVTPEGDGYRLVSFDELLTKHRSQVTVTLSASDGSSMAGITVSVTNVEDGSLFAEAVYDGQPVTLLIPIAAKYRVSVDAVSGYLTPAPVEYTAVAGVPRTINMYYQYGTRYGFRRAKNNSSPTARIEYLFDAVGKTPVSMNLSTNVLNYGDWEEFIRTVARPVMLTYEGTVDYELDPEDQTKKLDGSSSDVSNTGYAGNAMVEFGSEFKWVKRYQDSSYEYVIFSNVQFDSGYTAQAHTGEDGNVRDAFYWGMFKGTNVSSKLRSIGTGSVMVSQTRNTEVTYALNNGEGHYTIYKSGWDYIGDLLTLIAKSDNSQAVFGSGRSASGNTSAIGVGSLKAKGPFWGSSNGTSDVKVFWIEGFWGNVWEGMAGLILDGSNGIKTKMTPPYNFNAAGYTATGVVPSGTSGGYADTASVTKESGYVPKTANGSETTYYCDGLWFNNGQVGYALVGGDWDYAGKCGSRYVTLHLLASYTTTSIGSRLSFLPV